MSIRLIDEIYSALHNGEKPPYTNARGLNFLTMKSFDLGFIEKEEFDFIKYVEPKFKVSHHFHLFIIPDKYILPPTVD